MAARWQVLGDTGTNHPDNWVGGLGGPQLHAIAILFARDAAERERSVREHTTLLARTPGVEVLSSLDLDAIPSRYIREHFGYRDRLTTLEIEGTGVEPTPGSGPRARRGAGESCATAWGSFRRVTDDSRSHDAEPALQPRR